MKVDWTTLPYPVCIYDIRTDEPITSQFAQKIRNHSESKIYMLLQGRNVIHVILPSDDEISEREMKWLWNKGRRPEEYEPVISRHVISHEEIPHYIPEIESIRCAASIRGYSYS